MTKFERITAALEALPEARREEIAEIIETLFFGDLHPESSLSPEQLADLDRRLQNPGSLASPERVAAVLARFTGDPS